MTIKTCVVLSALVVSSGLLTGCAANKPAPLYQWGSYQPSVYNYLKAGSPDEQIATLEADLEKEKASGASAPPGLHAHLGVLYLQTGKADQGVQQLQTEKQLFPESGQYIDFLLNKTKKKEQ